VYLLQGVGAPERTVAVEGADAAALTSKPAPNFTLPALDGTTVQLSDYQGQVVMLNIWATWCPPCVRETPRLVRLANTYQDQGLVVLGMNTTYQDDRDKVAQFVREQQISYPILLDTNGEGGRLYPARLMPTTYLIDREGKIVYTRVGEIDEATLDEQIAALLKQ
jgi:cytochrome c biogenesis protein CcmG, thiol:disulfide interchange protein DsbE